MALHLTTSCYGLAVAFAPNTYKCIAVQSAGTSTIDVEALVAD